MLDDVHHRAPQGAVLCTHFYSLDPVTYRSSMMALLLWSVLKKNRSGSTGLWSSTSPRHRKWWWISSAARKENQATIVISEITPGRITRFSGDTDESVEAYNQLILSSNPVFLKPVLWDLQSTFLLSVQSQDWLEKQ